MACGRKKTSGRVSAGRVNLREAQLFAAAHLERVRLIQLDANHVNAASCVINVVIVVAVFIIVVIVV